MDRAGSMFKRWASCFLSCILPECEERAPTRQTWKDGNEREMAICHQQPHLVPPMRLVVYDELPSPGGIKKPSRASQVMVDGKSLGSKTTDRAMRAIKPRTSSRNTGHRPSISAPSDFRHVNHTARRVERFRPLELSIYLPGNRLPDLPAFDKFGLDQPDWLTPPPKTRSSPYPTNVERRSDSPLFQIPRKPLSGYRTSGPMFNGGGDGSSSRRRTLPEPITDTTDKAPWHSSDQPGRRLKNASLGNDQSTIVEEPDSPSERTSDATPSPFSSNKRPQITNGEASEPLASTAPALESTPPRTRRVAQWLHLYSSATPTPVQASFQADPSVHHRSRNLSGSTLSSANAEYYARTGSITSAGTATTLYPHPSVPSVLDKELESSSLGPPLQIRRQYAKHEPAYQEEQQRHGPSDVGLAF